MLNPDSSIHMNCRDSTWLFAVWAFCFAEDTFFCQQNLITNFVLIIDSLAVNACRVKIGLTLPVFSYFVPVGYDWRGFKDCMIGRANGPCCIVKEDINVIRGYCLGHIEFGCA